MKLQLDTDTKLPKVLIFGQPFNRNTGGGITLSNLFHGWDKDRIAVVGTGHMLQNLDSEICDSYYQLGSDENRWIFPFSKLQKTFESGPVDIQKYIDTVSSTHSPNIYEKPNIRKSLVDNILYPLLKYLGIFHVLSSIQLSKKFMSWLNQYNPDIIYVQVQGRDEIQFVQRLKFYFKKPMVVHIMDDWPSYVCAKGLFKNYWHNKIDNDFKTLLDSAELLMGISDQMAEEYKKRYDKQFLTFHNPIDLEFWGKYQRTSYELAVDPVILYAGRLGVGIDSSLEKIAEAITLVNSELGMSIKFALQTLERISWFEKYPCVQHRMFIEYEELPKSFAEADFLILPYDFSPISLRYVKYSMPTKVSEYMISGTPIIVFGPEETALVKYAQQHKWAKVITENDVRKLSEGIKDMILSQKSRMSLSKNAILLGELNHNSHKVRSDFRNSIKSLLN